MFHDNVTVLFEFLDRMVTKNNCMFLVDYDMDPQYSSREQLLDHRHTKHRTTRITEEDSIVVCYLVIMFISINDRRYDINEKND